VKRAGEDEGLPGLVFDYFYFRGEGKTDEERK
jgi:hypothetical protein